MISEYLKKQNVLEFTNIKELKLSALFVIEKTTCPRNPKTSALVASNIPVPGNRNAPPGGNNLGG